MAPEDVGEDGVARALRCGLCGAAYPVVGGVPRFVTDHAGSAAFGYQWNAFRREQLDRFNSTALSHDRFFAETGWSPEWLADATVLDVGCGAGRFADVASRYARHVVAVDASDAVDAARANLSDRPNVSFVQADVYRLPFRAGAFDACYCIGVVQHTPDPLGAVRALPRPLREGGRLALTIYERRPWTRLYGKYLLRPITRRLPSAALLRALKLAMPIAFACTEVLFRIPMLRRLLRFAIPVANYVDEPRLSLRQRYRWALLDTLDMLAPAHDHPQREAEVGHVLDEESVRWRRLANPGLNLVGVKTASA